MEVDESIKINFLLAYSGTIQSEQIIKSIIKENVENSSIRKEFGLLHLGAGYMYVMSNKSSDKFLLVFPKTSGVET